ncbi:MAG TPA: redoxin family protein [Gemmataceae bacterium]|nr:redoxin family protein [Gemmataceae bacterium]
MNPSQRFLIAIGLLAASLNVGAVAEETKRPAGNASSDAQKLAGVWLAESANMDGTSRLAELWTSKLTLTSDSFALSRYMELAKDLRGRFRIDSSTNPKAIDLEVEELDLSEAFTGIKFPACTVHGIYKLDGDHFTVCFPVDGRQARPSGFDVKDKFVTVLTFARADAHFTKLPEQVTVTVMGLDGKPAAGATLFESMFHQESGKGKPGWQFSKPVKTGADGKAKVAYENLRFHPLAARVESEKLLGFAAGSPASLQKGAAAIVLKPECRMSGSIVCEELRKAGKPLGWTNVYLMCDGRRIASYASTAGKVEFLVAPGTYTLQAYGSELRGKYVTVTVPEGASEFPVKPIALEASRLLLLKGGLAPELEGVVAWKGEKVKLADLKGKYVLLEFWGYWCGPCVHSMPVLIELHEKFADKGLAIIGVHLDIDGEVDTAAKYDDKIAPIKKKLWKDKSLPFPVALTSGKRIESGDNQSIRGRAAAQYGILGYPTTILIDREGKVVGKFNASDAKKAVAEVEKLLNDKK